MRHHFCGPSRQKNFAGPPEGDGCCGYMPVNSDHENKFLGSVCHEVWDTGDYSRLQQLSDPTYAESLVRDISASWDLAEQVFTHSYGTLLLSQNEVFLESRNLNFGTTDRLRLAGNAALIGDGKFGRWRVEHAARNLQGHNYAVLVWDTYSFVEDIWVWFGNPRLKDYTTYKFTRKDDYPRMRALLSQRLANAYDPDPSKFNFNPLNCSFCSRIDCPIRILKMSVTKKYIREIDPKDMTLDELAKLKKQTNSLKTLTKLIDDEVKSRILDDGESMPGFEIGERVHNREIIGIENFEVLKRVLRANQVDVDVSEVLTVSWSDIEQLIYYKMGGTKNGRPVAEKVLSALEDNGALTTNKHYVIKTTNEAEQ